MFKTINLYRADGGSPISTVESSDVTIPGSGTLLAYGSNSDGTPTPIFISISASQAEKYSAAVALVKAANSMKEVIVTILIDLNASMTMSTHKSYYVMSLGSLNVSDQSNIFASNLPDSWSLANITNPKGFIRVKEYSISLNTPHNSHVLFHDGSGTWYHLGKVSNNTITPITVATKSRVTISDCNADLLCRAFGYINNNDERISTANSTITTHTRDIAGNKQSINTLLSKTNSLEAKDTQLNNLITSNTREIDRVESIVSDIDIESIRQQLQGEIDRVDTAIGSLDTFVDEKVAEINGEISNAKVQMNETIADAEQDLSDMVNSFNENFSEEITETKQSLQSQLEDAVTELSQVKSEVDNRVQEIRDTVTDLVDDIEGTMRHVVTNISLTR